MNSLEIWFHGLAVYQGVILLLVVAVFSYLLSYVIHGRGKQIVATGRLKAAFSVIILFLFTTSLMLDWFSTEFEVNNGLYVILLMSQGAVFEWSLTDIAKIIVEVLDKTKNGKNNK